MTMLMLGGFYVGDALLQLFMLVLILSIAFLLVKGIKMYVTKQKRLARIEEKIDKLMCDKVDK
nr:hypothetical protein [Priestia megaterium]